MMKILFVVWIMFIGLIGAQEVTQTFILAADQENFTSLANLRQGQVFVIESVDGYVSFDDNEKVRDAYGKNQNGIICHKEGGIVVLEPGGDYKYASREKGHKPFWHFAENIIGQKIHARATGYLQAKVFDQDKKYSDNKTGFYRIKITVYPYNKKSAQIPQPAFHRELAFRWAPIHFQDCAKTRWHADKITKINFDGDWKADNNWNNLYNPQSDMRGAVYFSVIETTSHWFITYCFYHPRDWKDPWDIETDHENDLEGLTMLVRKSSQKYGILDGVITIAHLDFYSYVPEKTVLKENHENIDGKLIWKTDSQGVSRICTYQEAKGHGCYALQTDSKFGKEDDYFIYFPTQKQATEPKTRFDRNVSYRLVDMLDQKGLWARRNSRETFKSFGVFLRSHGSGGYAKTPWKWDDPNDPAKLKDGAMAFDPALLFSLYYHVPGLSHKYVYNPFRGIWK